MRIESRTNAHAASTRILARACVARVAMWPSPESPLCCSNANGAFFAPSTRILCRCASEPNRSI